MIRKLVDFALENRFLVLAGAGDDEAVVHIHERSFPQELRGAVEDRAADHESFGDEAVEDVACLLARFSELIRTW